MAAQIYALIGRAIRLRREEIGMTQAGLAKQAELSRTSITNIERGGQALFVHQFLELARILRVDVSTLIPSDVSIIGTAKQLTQEDRAIKAEFKSLLDRLDNPPKRGRSK